MNPALPIIMLVIGGLGIACIAWALVVRMRQKPKPQMVYTKARYVPPPNDEDVERLVAALQHTAEEADDNRRRSRDMRTGED